MKLLRPYPAVVGVYLPLAGGTMTGDIDATLHNITVAQLNVIDALIAATAAVTVRAQNVDGARINFIARDTGVGLVNVAALLGAADPYWLFYLPPVLQPAAIPAALVEGHFGYDSVTDKLWYRDAPQRS